ncbi:RNA polymerase sigma-70 factor (ECF subfamily) [Flavimobilis soli]|uniref:RNA polymerase sigma-70 factor (ECF subfamily) n=1 Tax=Flavimobilis soli TaxID=442709 RepID=A0A2A9ED06_9MICO|nr:RNA polymerase sigma factor SigE [Flavimobilis soli]PFG36142.1 RNA polymerase sigma-70 factor (ECF subfamily) [Flavimobilis soli]
MSDIGNPGRAAQGAAAGLSWEEIVRDHSARVFRLAYRLTGDRHDAEDLTQDVFVRVFRSLDRYEPGNFEGWLHRITTNLFLDSARRKQRIRMDAMGDDDGHLAGSVEAQPERGFEHGNLDLDVRRALDALPPDYRAAVVLCDIEGLSYEEIAVTLGVKLGTVRSRIHRARSQLRASLAHRRPTLEGAQAPAASGDAGLESAAHLWTAS